MFHRITLIGFVGQEPQMRYTEDGTPVRTFSVATHQVVSRERVAVCPTGWKESHSSKNWELTTWFRLTAWPWRQGKQQLVVPVPTSIASAFNRSAIVFRS